MKCRTVTPDATQPRPRGGTRLRVRRIILIGAAVVLLAGGVASWVGGSGGGGHPLDNMRVAWDQNRRSFDRYRRNWDEKRRAREQRQRAEEQASVQVGQPASNAVAKPVEEAPAPKQ